VHVFGLGMRLVTQITLESNYLLQQMERVFHLDDSPEVSEYIKSIGVADVNLRHLYAEGKPRDLAYQQIADSIVDAALAGVKCAYVTPGNPIFLNNVVLKLRDATRQRGVPFFVYPGVSSIDTLLLDLFLPVSEVGLQCFEATHFVRMRPRIDGRVPLLLFQPAVVEAFDVRYLTGVHEPGVRLLQEILLESYEGTQKWILLRSAMSRDDSPIVSTGILSDLVEKATHLELGTLIIPGEWQCDVDT
jgi:hypothetical protein